MKCRFVLFLVLCALFSCSDDEEQPATPPTALFVAVNGVDLLIVDVEGGQCRQFMVWQSNGARFYVPGFSTSGEWPRYKYTYSDNSGRMEMSATFEDESVFVADFNANLILQEYEMNVAGQPMAFTIEAKGVRFNRHDGDLDVNRDRIPDLLQPQIFSKFK